jgi:hypothetical protein
MSSFYLWLFNRIALSSSFINIKISCDSWSNFQLTSKQYTKWSKVFWQKCIVLHSGEESLRITFCLNSRVFLTSLDAFFTKNCASFSCTVRFKLIKSKVLKNINLNILPYSNSKVFTYCQDLSKEKPEAQFLVPH